MLNSLIALDQRLFMFLNGELTNGFLDWFMPFITDAKTWLPFVLLAWFLIICRGGKRLRVLALALLLSVGGTDLFCARVVKKAVGRVRPCSLEQTDSFRCRLLLPVKTSKSFPSNHSANTAAFAVVTLMICGFKAGLPMLLLAFLIGYSRIYVGVHFPLDVVAGWLFGALIAWLITRLILARADLQECVSQTETPSTVKAAADKTS
ncbi:MAG TPA: phosphatase PAP2 family protein [Candidatus Rifleibacterium sp.]|nr:phosphatase PAP2 family protein [Candidatus Rifleibacterium sp.]